MDIRILGPADAAVFQSLRLAGLREAPSAFSSSLEEELPLSLSVLEERLRPQDDRAIFAAFEHEQLLGIVGLQRQAPLKLAHKAFLWGMYVTPAARNQGLGRRLLTEALAFAASTLRVRQVTLGVNAGNVAAIALYEHLGFSAFGREPACMLVDGIAHDELQMVHFLDGDAGLPGPRRSSSS
jgi:ribosomal protein S18 acetylase RimI-like enzyme